ncbi:glycine/D-amino acid oxidase-like deaminating enzyme [Cohnella thailandensis]|nr:glycine/D-amino acid oxidase-like deaminating enzyme [Cohnella thailandensis]
MNGTPFPESYWLASAERPVFRKLDGTVTVDTAVIGAGIAGITTAYLLAKEGKNVALVTAGRIMNGTTGHTTAKVTAQHGLIYDEYIRDFGEERAGLFYRASMDGLSFIRRTIEEHQIDCGFSEEDAVVYTNVQNQVSKLEDEFKAYARLGIPGSYSESIPLPVPAIASVKMTGQAQFHPIPYLSHLIREFVRLGGQVYEETTVETVEEGTPSKLISTNGYEVICQDVVSCSHFPVYESGFYYARLHPESSYVIAVASPKPYPGGMYINAENPTRSIRAVHYREEELLLVGGESHKTGQGVPTMEHYEALERFARESFGAAEMRYRWSALDFETLDKLPYIGRSTRKHPRSYVATGFRKWGMTSGTVAALVLTDLIMARDNPYAELFDPSRFEAGPSVKTFIKENANVAKEFVKGKLEWMSTKPEELGPDQGALVRLHGRKVGAYRARTANSICSMPPVPIWVARWNGTTVTGHGIVPATDPGSTAGERLSKGRLSSL